MKNFTSNITQYHANIMNIAHINHASHTSSCERCAYIDHASRSRIAFADRHQRDARLQCAERDARAASRPDQNFVICVFLRITQISHTSSMSNLRLTHRARIAEPQAACVIFVIFA